jgi:hypothetical protein
MNKAKGDYDDYAHAYKFNAIKLFWKWPISNLVNVRGGWLERVYELNLKIALYQFDRMLKSLLIDFSNFNSVFDFIKLVWR